MLSRKLLSSPTSVLSASALTGAGLAYYTFSSPTSSSPSALTSPPSSKAARRSPFPNLGFTTLTLTSSHLISPDVKELTFAVPAESRLAGGLPLISSILTQTRREDSWFPTFRPYTPVDITTSSTTSPTTTPETDDPSTQAFLTLAVKLYPSGKASSTLHSLIPGDEILARTVPPLHEFDYKPNASEKIVLVAGGAGITPFMQLLRSVFHNNNSSTPTQRSQDKTRLELVYAAKTPRDLLFRDELLELEKKFPERFGVRFVVNDAVAAQEFVPSASNAGIVGTLGFGKETERLRERVGVGYISQLDLEKALAPSSSSSSSSSLLPSEQRGKEIVTQTKTAQEMTKGANKILICGPPGLVDAVAGVRGGPFGFGKRSGGLVQRIGVDSKDVHVF